VEIKLSNLAGLSLTLSSSSVVNLFARDEVVDEAFHRRRRDVERRRRVVLSAQQDADGRKHF